MKLKPASVLAAARADISRRARNSEIARDRKGPVQTEGYALYAFHRTHVRKSADAQELLIRALMDPTEGLASDKYNTRLLYGDATLLLAAIHLTHEAAGA